MLPLIKMQSAVNLRVNSEDGVLLERGLFLLVLLLVLLALCNSNKLHQLTNSTWD